MIVTAVIPARNEAKRIRPVVEHTLSFVDHVVVVDDGSSDGTMVAVQNMADPKVHCLRHEVNLGKGAALKTGCDAAVLLKSDVIVCLDADGQHNPASIPLFLRTLADQQVDVVFGMRQFNNKMPLTMLVGNRLLSQFIHWLFRVMVHDTQSGFRAFTTVAYQKLRWHSSGYEAETEMIIRTGEYKLKYAEVDIDTIYYDNYKGTTALDGLRIFFHILRWKFI
ncbi:MAG: glycosyl transferase family 2 [uncultured bacterium]|nr:MAG: glycosyl transferase family 2 [uncultured bacterium]